MASAQHPVDGTLGVSFDERIAGAGANFDQGGSFALGKEVKGSDGTVYMYVHAAAAITLWACCVIDENFEAQSITTTLARQGLKIGFAQAAFADNDFGWLAIRGANIKTRLKAACAPDIRLYTSATTGVLDDDGSTVFEQVVGAVAIATATGTTTGGDEIIVTTNPHAATP